MSADPFQSELAKKGNYVMGYRRNRSYCCFLLLVFAVECVYAQKIKVEYNPKENFTAFKTYSWITEESYQRPLLAMNIIGAVDEQLRAKSLTRVDANGDLIVTAYGAVDSDLNVTWRPDIYVMPGLYGPVWWTQGVWIPGSSSAVQIKKGTLVVDIADPHSKQLKWRGIANANFNPKNQKQSLDLVNKSIEKMFRQYPSRP
jgi:hypothetical protein